MALGALLASCTQDEALPGGVVPPGHSLYVASAIIAPPAKTETEVNTRVAGDDVPVTVTTGSLGIFRSKGTGYTGTLDNLKYTYMGVDKGWQPATAADTLFLNGDDVEVCAYYPYNGDAFFGSPEQILLASGKYFGSGVANPSDSYEGTDICYAVNRTVNAARRATTFEMKHALALLEFRISKEAGYVGDCRITSISIMNPELILGSSIDITNGTYATTPAKGTLTYNPGTDADGILIESSAVTTGALLIPFVPAADGLTIAFTVNGTPVEAAIPTSDIAQLEAGRRYSVKVTMKANSMQVTGVDMMPWDEVGVGGDDYTWYPAEDAIKLTDPIHIGSYDWAWSNLEKDAAGYKLGSYQKLPGSLWAWNVLEPMTPPVKRGDQPAPNTGAYMYAQDPCSQLEPAGTWTLPTQQQIKLLLASGHVNGPDGCWFGTSTVPGKDDGTYLFLPASNLLTYHGFVSDSWLTELNEGVGGYWLSQVNSGDLKETMLIVGEHAHLTSTPVFLGLPFTSGSQTLYGASVRCVEKARTTITLGGVEWAMGNLVKKSDGTYVIDEHQAVIPTVTGTPGTVKTWSAVAEGYHFTWNSLERKEVDDNASWEYDIANDPCAKVAPAGTWRTPTKAEFESAIAQGVCRDATYTIDGVDVPGYYLGTTSQPAKGEGDKYLFLPRAGGGDQSTFYDAATSYWSSTEVEPAGASQTLAYKFSDGGISSGMSKTHPDAIRCVKGSLEKVYTLTNTAEVKIGTTTYARTNLNHDFTFEAEPWISGKMNGTDIDYWYWGRREINTNATYTKDVTDWSVLTGEEEDPCKSVSGGGWRLPTQKELNALAKKVLPADSKVSINGEVLTVTGSNGFVKNASATTGGTVFYDATTKNVLFLPAAGTEDQVGNITNTALRGGYQSSEAIQNGANCVPLSISQNTLGVGVPGWSYRYTGNSIRCVKK